MKLHCPHCNQLLEAADSMSGQAIKCPACSADLRVPTVADSKPTSQSVQPERALRQPMITKSSNPGSTRAEHPPETELSAFEINKALSRIDDLKSEDEEGIEIHQTPARRSAPGSVSSLVLGILSIPLALAQPDQQGVIGFVVALTVAFSNDDFVVVFHFGSLVAGILAIVQAGKANRAIQSSAGRYDGGGMAIAGMTCGIIGITIFLFFMFAISSEL